MSDLYLPLIIQYEETSYAHEICWLLVEKKEMRLNKSFCGYVRYIKEGS